MWSNNNHNKVITYIIGFNYSTGIFGQTICEILVSSLYLTEMSHRLRRITPRPRLTTEAPVHCRSSSKTIFSVRSFKVKLTDTDLDPIWSHFQIQCGDICCIGNLRILFCYAGPRCCSPWGWDGMSGMEESFNRSTLLSPSSRKPGDWFGRTRHVWKTKVIKHHSTWIQLLTSW